MSKKALNLVKQLKHLSGQHNQSSHNPNKGSSNFPAAVDSVPWIKPLNKIGTERYSHSIVVTPDDWSHFNKIKSGVKLNKRRSSGGFGLCYLNTMENCQQNPDDLDVAVGLVYNQADQNSIKQFQDNTDKYWDSSSIGTVHAWNIDKQGRVVDTSLKASKNDVYIGKVLPKSLVNSFADDGELESYIYKNMISPNFGHVIGEQKGIDLDKVYNDWQNNKPGA